MYCVCVCVFEYIVVMPHITKTTVHFGKAVHLQMLTSNNLLTSNNQPLITCQLLEMETDLVFLTNTREDHRNAVLLSLHFLSKWVL